LQTFWNFWNKIKDNKLFLAITGPILAAIILGILKSTRDYAVKTINEIYEYLLNNREIPNWQYLLFWLITIFAVFCVIKYLRWKFPKELEIVSATYGAAENAVDVAPTIRCYISNNIVKFKVKNSIFPPPDPAPHQTKVLTIEYRVNGKAYKKKFREGEILRLP
jgi:hypothetical protein